MASPGHEGGIFIGTSGWAYRHWRSVFFPPGLPRSKELEFLATEFGTVETNGTFYSLTTPAACAISGDIVTTHPCSVLLGVNNVDIFAPQTQPLLI